MKDAAIKKTLVITKTERPDHMKERIQRVRISHRNFFIRGFEDALHTWAASAAKHPKSRPNPKDIAAIHKVIDLVEQAPNLAVREEITFEEGLAFLKVNHFRGLFDRINWKVAEPIDPSDAIRLHELLDAVPVAEVDQAAA